MNLEEQTIREEGKRDKPYVDCCGQYWKDCTCSQKGNLTIGIGCNLDTGLSDVEIAFLFHQRLDAARTDVATYLPWTDILDPVRRDVFVAMAFNMGIGKASNKTGLLGFSRMLTYAKAGDWINAAQELVDSKFGRGVTRSRAARLAKQLITGEYQ